jgi:hypothetical protein
MPILPLPVMRRRGDEASSEIVSVSPTMPSTADTCLMPSSATAIADAEPDPLAARRTSVAVRSEIDDAQVASAIRHRADGTSRNLAAVGVERMPFHVTDAAPVIAIDSVAVSASSRTWPLKRNDPSARSTTAIRGAFDRHLP